MSQSHQRRRRVSAALPLMLAGSTLLVACSSDTSPDSQTERLPETLHAIRDEYTSLEDCQKDWGDKACETPVSSQITGSLDQSASTTAQSLNSGHSTYVGHSGYWGPYYVAGGRERAQADFGVRHAEPSRAVAQRSSVVRSGSVSGVSRGGFGGSARGSGGG